MADEPALAPLVLASVQYGSPDVVQIAQMARYALNNIEGGELRIEPTAAMTMIDVDGWLVPDKLAQMAAWAAARAIRRLDLGGSTGIDFPTLRDKAARLAVIDTYAAAANNGCAVKDKKYVGQSQAGSAFFEVACNDGKGYMYKVDGGKLAQTYECAKASNIMGGCTLTDAKEAMMEQNGLYTRLAKDAKFDCEVSKYAPFPGPAGKDVVELACSNRPDGGVGIFGTPKTSDQVIDCARAPIAGYRCSFSKPESAYKVVTADLKKLGKNECEVSATRVVGKTAKGTTFMEVACADGLKGYIIEYQPQPLNALTVIGCAFTKDCKLPGNT